MSNHPNRESFAPGDLVRWKSQAGGYSRTKEGEVVEVVRSGERPDRDRFPDLYKGGAGFGREGVSYVVRVKNKHYWPRTSGLAIVGKDGIQ